MNKPDRTAAVGIPEDGILLEGRYSVRLLNIDRRGSATLQIDFVPEDVSPPMKIELGAPREISVGMSLSFGGVARCMTPEWNLTLNQRRGT